MVKAIIFDFDGVIADSEKLHLNALKSVLTSYGKEYDETLFKSTLGLSLEEILQIYKNKQKLHSPLKTLVNQYERYFMAHVDKDLHMIDGFSELITLVTLHGFKVAIASSAKKEYIVKALKKFKLLRTFQNHIVSIEMVEKGKPAPDIFIKAAELLGEKPKNCLVFENTIDGIYSAQNAGMQTILLTDNRENHFRFNLNSVTSLRDINIDLLKSLTSFQ